VIRKTEIIFIYGFALFCFFIGMWGVHCGIYSYNMLLQYSYKYFFNISYFNSPSSPILLYPLPPLLEQFQQVSLLHLHTCVHRICTIFTLLHPFSSTYLLSPVTTTCRTCSAIMFSNFVHKKMHFFLV
jgi:hypothetical protein